MNLWYVRNHSSTGTVSHYRGLESSGKYTEWPLGHCTPAYWPCDNESCVWQSCQYLYVHAMLHSVVCVWKVECGNSASICMCMLCCIVYCVCVCVWKVESGNTATICMCMPCCMVYSVCVEGGVWQHCQYLYVHAVKMCHTEHDTVTCWPDCLQTESQKAY